MARVRSTDELILNAIDYYRVALPQLDTKPGTVARDLMIDGPSIQLSRVYEELARIQNSQSIRQASGIDLDRLGANYGATRRGGSVASGVALVTFSGIDYDIPINIGDIVTANNGASFKVVQSITVSPVNENTYRATASKYRAALDLANISDEYAVEVMVESTSPGTLGNISRYALISTSIIGATGVTNASSFSGGSSSENDSLFRNRILSLFGGANTGTALAYRNAVLSDPQVIDAIVIEPGDPLMTRDGTVVNTLENGDTVIVSEGTGGKVDIYAYGFRFSEILDSYIYRDKSNRGDPTDPANDFVLGQLPGSTGKTVARRRIEDLDSGILPDQPVNNIIEVFGSSSGPNFVEKSVDNLGRVTGNYELIRDTGVYSGSPWGFDKIRFIDDRIRGFTEEQTKGRFNGQDSLTYSDVTEIGGANQNIQVINENSILSSSDRSVVFLSHTPVTAVTRVYNVNTGERYVVTDQNPDGSGPVNTTGRIIISGGTLPSHSDILQVDYTWMFDFDPDVDFDNKVRTSGSRNIDDSIDWGFSNIVSRERASVSLSGDVFRVTVTHPISSVIYTNTFSSIGTQVELVSGRLAVVTPDSVKNVVSITRDNDLAELFDTNKLDGSFTGLTIFLPTDTVANIGDIVTVVYNSTDLFVTDGVTGSFNNNIITLPSNSNLIDGEAVEVSYISNVKTILPQTLMASLPAVKNANGFDTKSQKNIGTQPSTNILDVDGSIVKNLRKAPSRLQLTIAGQISPGTITVTGSSITRIEGVLVASDSGFTQNLSSVIKVGLGMKPSDFIDPANYFISRVVSVQRVEVNDSFDILSRGYIYDIKGYSILDNELDISNSISSPSLSSLEFSIPKTSSNINYEPKIGDSFLVTFYVAKRNDSENVSFSKSGSLSTQKRFYDVKVINTSSGFISGESQAATLTVNNMNQPVSGARYSVEYDYTSPKPNERISIRYNKNSVISDSTRRIEDVRNVSADVLVKSAIPITVDIDVVIIVTNAFINSSEIVRQNVADALTTALSSSQLGTIVDESDLVSVASAVSGVDRVRVTYFNRDGEAGRVLSISAKRNEYIQPGTINVSVEKRG